MQMPSSRRVVRFHRCMAQSDWRHVFGDERECPPTWLTRFGEAVAIPISADKIWWRVREWVASEQTQNSPFAFEKALDGDGLQVGRDLLMREKATFKGDVILANAKIDRQLSMSGSTLSRPRLGELTIPVAAIERDLAAMKVDYAVTQLHLDNMDRRIERIEKGLA